MEKQVKKATILGITACAALRGLGKLGYSVAQGIKIAEHFGATLNPRTVNSHIRLGKNNSDDYGSVPKLSTEQVAQARKIAGEPGQKEVTKLKVVKPPKKKQVEAVKEEVPVTDAPKEAASKLHQKIRTAVA